MNATRIFTSVVLLLFLALGCSGNDQDKKSKINNMQEEVVEVKRYESLDPGVIWLIDYVSHPSENPFWDPDYEYALTSYARGNKKQAVVALIEALYDESSERNDVVLRSVSVLGAMGEVACDAVPHLLKLIKGEEKFKYTAIKAIGRIGPKAKEAVTTLMEFLDDSDKWLRFISAEALGKIGYDAIQAIPKLRELALNDPFFGSHTIHEESSYVVRETAAEAVARIESALPPGDDSEDIVE